MEFCLDSMSLLAALMATGASRTSPAGGTSAPCMCMCVCVYVCMCVYVFVCSKRCAVDRRHKRRLQLDDASAELLNLDQVRIAVYDHLDAENLTCPTPNTARVRVRNLVVPEFDLVLDVPCSVGVLERVERLLLVDVSGAEYTHSDAQ